MKHVVFILLCLVAIMTGSCQVDDFSSSPTIHTLDMDLESAKKYMSIDTVEHRYVLLLTEEQRVKEGISKEHLNLISTIVSKRKDNNPLPRYSRRVQNSYVFKKDFSL